MNQHPIYPLRLEPERKERWKAAAKTEGISLAAWIIAKCESSGIVFVPAPPKENAHLPAGFEEKLATLDAPPAKKAPRTKAQKKQARKANAASARASMVVPQRKGGMVDVHIDPADTEKECPHGKGYGQACWKCDPKYGAPDYKDKK